MSPYFVDNEEMGVNEEAFRQLTEAIQSPIALDGNDYAGKYVLTKTDVRRFAKSFSKKIFMAKSTGVSYFVGMTGIGKVSNHRRPDDIHLKSIAHIKELIENAIFISNKKSPPQAAGYFFL